MSYSLLWAETAMVLHVNSPSPFRERNMMDAPLRGEMMGIAGVPLQRTMTVTNPLASALRLPCQQWEEIQKEVPVPSPSPSWETPMNPVPHLDAAMARCGVPPPRVTMTTASGVSVLTKATVCSWWQPMSLVMPLAWSTLRTPEH